MSIFNWKNISEVEKSRLQANFSEKSLVKDLVRYENGFLMPRLFAEKIQKRIFDFELRDDDIWIVTFPKCGTTWTQVNKKISNKSNFVVRNGGSAAFRKKIVKLSLYLCSLFL